MKTAMERILRDERGAAMVAALILLLMSGLIAAPLLSHMGTGLIAGEVYEARTAELYAADAGVEDAVWRIHQGMALCPNQSTNYTIADVNGRNVAVTITLTHEDETGLIYFIQSIAGGEDSSTEIQAYIDGTIVTGNYSGILENVVTSPCDYTLGGPTEVDPPEGEEHGPEANYEGDWPTAEILAELYWEDVKNEIPYGSSSLDVKNYPAGVGPLYRDGTLSIVNTGTAGLTVQLEGTLYVTGDTLIGMTDKAFTLDLNGHTIFVESDTGAAPEDDPCNPGNQYALKIGTKCTLTGSGCIIAVGGIEFKPNLAFAEGDFVFVISLTGKTYMQPNGDFYGSLAGLAEVYIQNGDASWFASPFVDEGLNFPYIAELERLYDVYSWEVSQQ